jgi:hypothetical protein
MTDRGPRRITRTSCIGFLKVVSHVNERCCIGVMSWLNWLNGVIPQAGRTAPREQNNYSAGDHHADRTFLDVMSPILSGTKHRREIRAGRTVAADVQIANDSLTSSALLAARLCNLV